MKLTGKQIVQLWAVFQDTLKVPSQHDGYDSVAFLLPLEARIELANKIIDQQSNEVIERGEG